MRPSNYMARAKSTQEIHLLHVLLPPLEVTHLYQALNLNKWYMVQEEMMGKK